MSERIGVVGAGYVGLPLAVAFAHNGDRVTVVDTNAARVAAINESRSPVEDIADQQLAACGDLLSATTDYASLANCSSVVICVPTPLDSHREPDLSALEASATALGEVLQEGTLVVLESTSYPGTTRDVLAPILAKRSGLVAGDQFAVAFSPERIDPGRDDFTLANTPKVVGGINEASTQRAADFYSAVCETVLPVSSPEAAEMSKLLENIFRSVNIALVNELAILADRMGIDFWEVLSAAETKPFGFMRFDPGPGLGGHCLPIDPFYLSWKAREYDLTTEFIELAGRVNQRMPYYCLERIERSLNDDRKPLSGSKILVIGAAYKGGVSDTRESPALKLIELLQGRAADVSYYDPHVPQLEAAGLHSIDPELLLDAAGKADLLVIVTAHPSVDHAELARTAQRTLDFRATTRSVAGHSVEYL